MANSSNAYATAKPIETNITDWVAKQANMDLAYKQDKRLADAEAEKSKDKKKADAEKAFKDIELKYSLSGYANHDEPVIAFIDGPGGLLEQSSEIASQLDKTPNDIKLRLKLANLQKGVSRINDITNAMKEQSTVLAKGILPNGGLSPYLNKTISNQFVEMMDKKKYDWITNDDGVVSVKRKDFVDEDGDGIADVFTLEDVQKLSTMGAFKPAFNTENWAKDAKLRYASENTLSKDPSNPYITNELKGFNEDLRPALKTEINQMFGNDSKTMTDAAKSFIADKLGLDPNSYDDVKFTNLKSNYENSFIGSYEKTDKKTYDSAGEDRDQAAAAKAKQDAIKNNLDNRKQTFQEKKYAEGKADKDAEMTAKYGNGWKEAITIDNRVSDGGYVTNPKALDKDKNRIIPKGVPINSRSFNFDIPQITLGKDKFPQRLNKAILSPDGKKMWFNISKTKLSNGGQEIETNEWINSSDDQNQFIINFQKGVKDGKPFGYKSIKEFQDDLFKIEKAENAKTGEYDNIK